MRTEVTSVFARLSLEFEVLCDRHGTVTWADDRARHLDMERGQILADRSAPGAEGKITQFLEEAAKGPVEAWEIAIIAHGPRRPSRSARAPTREAPRSSGASSRRTTPTRSGR